MITNTIQEAITTVNGFSELYYSYVRKLSISGKSDRTIESYTLSLAQMSLYFKQQPLKFTENQLEEYLYYLKKNKRGESSFKFAIYGLRSLYKNFGKTELKAKLPSMPRSKKLPVILSMEECRKLISYPLKLRDRFMIAFFYSSGLRISELSNLKIIDVDKDRMQIHVKQGKGNKDRYVPLSRFIASSLAKYIKTVCPKNYLFNSTKPGRQFSIRGIQRVIHSTSLACGIKKEVTSHTLRHTYATHLLENGVDLLTIKNVMGHERIETTMIYLHVSKPCGSVFKNPLDVLFKK